MTKTELIERVAKDAGLTKADAGKALNATIDTIKASLKKGQPVVLVGFGSFKISKRKARKGRNPRTGAALKIAACKIPKFSAGKTLKDSVNGK